MGNNAVQKEIYNDIFELRTDGYIIFDFKIYLGSLILWVDIKMMKKSRKIIQILNIATASSFKCKPCLRILSIFFVQNEHKGNYGLLQMRNIRKIRIYDMYNSYHNFAVRVAWKEKWDVETFLLASAKYYKAGTCHFYSLSH